MRQINQYRLFQHWNMYSCTSVTSYILSYCLFLLSLSLFFFAFSIMLFWQCSQVNHCDSALGINKILRDSWFLAGQLRLFHHRVDTAGQTDQLIIYSCEFKIFLQITALRETLTKLFQYIDRTLVASYCFLTQSNNIEFHKQPKILRMFVGSDHLGFKVKFFHWI